MLHCSYAKISPRIPHLKLHKQIAICTNNMSPGDSRTKHVDLKSNGCKTTCRKETSRYIMYRQASTWLTSSPRPCQERPLLDVQPMPSSRMTFFRRYSPHQRTCINIHYILSSPLNMRAHIEHIYNTYTRFCESIQIYIIYHAYAMSLRLQHKHHICLSLCLHLIEGKGMYLSPFTLQKVRVCMLYIALPWLTNITLGTRDPRVCHYPESGHTLGGNS